MTRPAGISPGALGLLLAWLGGAAVARMTGATPVVIVLAAGLVLFGSAVVSGWLGVRGARVGTVLLPGLATVGDEIAVSVDVRSNGPVWIVVRCSGAQVAAGWARDGRFAGRGRFTLRGEVEQTMVEVRSSGAVGLVWWRRKVAADHGRCVVAPASAQGDVPIERVSIDRTGHAAGAAGAIAGEIDGVRQWREGDSEKFVHWASTLRSGELIVHDRRRGADQQWLIRARSGASDPDREAAAVRWAAEQGLRSDAEVSVAIDDGEPIEIRDPADAARWSACADLGKRPIERTRPTLRRSQIEPETTARRSGRWWAAAATFIALAMLIDALGLGMLVMLLSAGGVAAGAVVSARTISTGESPPLVIRTLVGAGALLSLGMIAASSGRFEGLLSILRGPLPQILITLVVLHGFESRDRRTIRVGLGISAVVLMYASGFRVDGMIGWWLLAFAICFAMTIKCLAGPTESTDADPRPSSWLQRGAASAAALGAMAGVLVLVPVPEGPARLTLPTFISDDGTNVPTPGAIAGPDGEVRNDPGGDESDRAPAGQAGGYTGFAQSMDTSVRGALSDEVVMRVRAPEPDFWRGQTFSTFDGRHWYADEAQGVFRSGPTIDIPPALGDTADPSVVEVDEFVQTYFIETDMPNLIFGAYQPEQVIVDADVWTRSDGAIRASQVLEEGSIYTVVSARPRVTNDILRRQGLVGTRLSDFGRDVLAPYLVVPDSTSPATIALANELAEGAGSTYDVIQAYELWLSQNVEYDLNAPLPDGGDDAVHDFLFESRLGFCEQIASSLAIMLRTQGVPTRVATGYLPGERDRIAGVFEVRGSDAHAWVEVWFPFTGWQAFDPTASVPLSGDTEVTSVGADMAAGVGAYVGDHFAGLMLVAAVSAGLVLLLRLSRELRRRHNRGRWGLLQDRFAMLSSSRGASELTSNPQRASVWTDGDDLAVAQMVAARLDAVEFDPGFDDADQVYDETQKLMTQLGRSDQ